MGRPVFENVEAPVGYSIRAENLTKCSCLLTGTYSPFTE